MQQNFQVTKHITNSPKMQFFSLVSIFLFLSFLFLLRKWKNNSQTKKLPLGPWKFPFIGSMHLMVGGIPHRVFRELAKKYGLLMHFEVGEVSAIIATSAEVANQVPKTHNLAFACRPKFMGIDIICYGSRDIAYIPYGEYWRQMCKICLMELLSAKNVRPFSSIRHDEVVCLIDSIRYSSSSGELINFSEKIIWFASTMTCRSAFGNVLKEQAKFIKII
ncbi:hypothetical protein P3L10_004818 [Capsicum annuum]